MKLKSWEKRLVDEQCGSDTKQLLKNAEQWEAKYLNALPKPGIYCCMLCVSAVFYYYFVASIQVKHHTMHQARSHWISFKWQPSVTPLRSSVHPKICRLTSDLAW